MLRAALVAVLTAMLILTGLAGAQASAPFLSKKEARWHAVQRVKKEVRRNNGDRYRVRRCVRYTRSKVGCDYRYTFTADPDATEPDSHCRGRMMVRKTSSRVLTFGRGVRCGFIGRR